MELEDEKPSLIGIFTTDEKFIVGVWDAALEQMTGISAEEARGRSIVETIPNLEARGLLARFRRVLEEGTIEVLAPAFHRFLILCRPLRPSQRFAEMRQSVTIAPLKENETICGLIVTVEDVTARIEREIELTEKLRDADEGVRLQAAKAISREEENLAEDAAAPIIDALSDKNWRVRRELVEGLSRRAAPDAIAALLRAMHERHFDFAVLNSALQVLQATSVKTIETLTEFLRGDDADLRMQAALTLGEQNDQQAVPALLAALEDENVNVRYHAAEALGKLKAGEAVGPLLSIAETRDFFLSFVALDALRQIADASAAPRVLPLLNDDFLREAAVGTLGATGDETIVEPLVSLLNRERSAAASVAEAIGALSAHFAGDPAKSALIVDAVRRTIDADGRTNLLEALQNSSENDSIRLVSLAGWIDDEKIREELAFLLESETAGEAAARSLARQGSAAVDLLVGKLGEAEPDQERTIARLLGEIGDERAFGPLADLLENGEAASRPAAVAALKTLAHPETIRRVCGLLDAADPHMREAALRIVGSFGAKGCENRILELCADDDERVKKAAVEQLPVLADERALGALIRALGEDSPRVRETAAKALARVESEEAVAALRAALGDADSWTRYFAVRALGTLRDAQSLEVLSEMAETDEAEHVRAAAGEVLSQLRTSTNNGV